MESIIAVGLELLRVRQALGHNKFGTWRRQEFGWSRRTAYNYMNAAKVFGDKCAIVAHLQPLTVYEFSRPTLSEPAKEEIRRILDEGEAIEEPEFWRRVSSVMGREKSSSFFQLGVNPPLNPEAVALAEFLLDRLGAEVNHAVDTAIFELTILKEAIQIMFEFDRRQVRLFPTRLTKLSYERALALIYTQSPKDRSELKRP